LATEFFVGAVLPDIVAAQLPRAHINDWFFMWTRPIRASCCQPLKSRPENQIAASLHLGFSLDQVPSDFFLLVP
jgi:hypothetical protein